VRVEVTDDLGKREFSLNCSAYRYHVGFPGEIEYEVNGHVIFSINDVGAFHFVVGL